MSRSSSTLLVVAAICAATGAAWYSGKLAFLYARYPDKLPLATSEPIYHPLIIAHRGYETVAPENTLPAIEAAIANQINFVEIDIRLTADGVPVIMHDSNTKRTTGHDAGIATLSFDQVRSLDAGSWFSPEFAGTRVPTLEEALQMATGKICIFADIKVTPTYEVISLLKAFANKAGEQCLVIGLLGNAQFEIKPGQETFFASMDDKQRERLEERSALSRKGHAKQLVMFARYWPGAPLTLPFRPGDSIEDLLQSYPNLVAVDVPIGHLTPDLVKALHASGLWTIVKTGARGDDTFKRVLDTGVDAIWLSNIAGLKRFLENRAREEQN